MPPSTLQARIKAFEALGSGASKEVLDGVAIHTEPEHLLDRPHSPSAASIPPIVPTTYSPSASPNSLRNRTSLLDLKDWVIDDGPLGVSPATAILTGYSPLPTAKPLPHESAPLISFDGSPPKFVGAPPLPPRKLSFNSPRSVSAPAASPTTSTTSQSNNMLMPPSTDPLTLKDFSPSDSMRRAQGHTHGSSVSSFHSVSLSSEGDDAATPGAFHAFPMEREWTGTGTEDGESLDESFENVSAPSSFLPSSSFPPRQPSMSPGKPALALAAKSPPPPPPSFQPPKLPQRPIPRGPTNSFASHSSSPSPVTSGVGSPIQTRASSASSSSLSLQNTRRVPPPPPPSAANPPTNGPLPRSRPPSARTSVQSTTTTASDRSSLFSQGTTNSRTSISSRTPSISVSASTPTFTGAKQQVQASRTRYDALFTANVCAHAPKPPPPPTPTPAKRQNAGWRGLSFDVPAPIPASPAPPSPALTEPGPDARLDGRLVREIWLKSRLEPLRLRGIWNECDSDGMGSLDRDAFVRGMARIDEELRRAQVLGRARAGSSARAPRSVPSRPILR